MNDFASAFEGSTVLVTGGAGAIGSNLTAQLSEYDAAEVVILDDLSSGYRWLVPDRDNITFIEGSILNEEKLKRVFKKDPDYVFHLAAHFANQNSVDHPETDIQINGQGTLKVLQYAQLTDVERFVYASSGCGIYGGDAEIPYEEDDFTIEHDTPYQITKQLGEMYTYYFHRMYDLPIANARFFNSFGPGEVPGKYRNVIPNFFYWAKQGRELPITGDGTETRDWTYVGDIVDGLMRMAVVDDAIGEAFNLATGSDNEVIEMAEKISERVDNAPGVEYVGRREWDNKARIVGSIEKTQRVLGYEPETSFDEGLDRVHDWFENNWEQIDECAEF
jgi:nucleoside-diphosphate-sugar epimerase